MNRLTASRYNWFIPQGNDSYLGYNFLYRSILRIPAEAFPEVEQVLKTLATKPAAAEELGDRLGVAPESLHALRETHFIIDDGFDELSFIKFRYQRSLFAGDDLSLVILPTLWCNFSCPYCFEVKKRLFMDASVQEALARWVEGSFRHKRNFHVTWFGGEPLLGKKTIIDLTRRFQTFCQRIGASYSASLVTNGYCLDSNFQAALASLNITSVQITLDGDKDDHDQFRNHGAGRGSFDRIYRNILSLVDNCPDCSLRLRVNCGDNNCDRIPALLERFPVEVRKRSKLYFRWIWANEASGRRDFAGHVRGEQPFRGLGRFYSLAAENGWITSNPHNSRSDGYCEVDYLDHYEIDPLGNLFLCTHTFDPSEAIGSLREGDEPIRSARASEYARWYAAGPFEDEKCISCPLLPVCWGGCRKSRVEGHRECIEERDSMDIFVRNLISEKQKDSNILERR